MGDKPKIVDAYHNNNEVEWLKFPYEIVDVDDETNKELLGDFTGIRQAIVTRSSYAAALFWYPDPSNTGVRARDPTAVSSYSYRRDANYFGERTGFVQVGPKKWLFPSGYRQNAEFYYNFQARPDDVWIVTFPRSGTTWSQEMVWLLANDLNYETAAEIPLEKRFPFLEFSSFVHPEVKQEFLEENRNSEEKCEIIEEISKPAWMTLAQYSGKRFIKTHLPFELLPPNLLQVGCKVIYVARNPKDVAVSFYHLNRLFRTQGFLRDFSKYWDYFERNLQPWTPYWSHLQQGWEKKDEENLLFMFYEDMNKNPLEGIEKVAKFLRKSYSRQQLEKLAEHLKIENFRNNKSTNAEILKELGIISKTEQGFVRKGKTGGWRDYFIGELNEKADKWIENNTRNSNLKFPHLQ